MTQGITVKVPNEANALLEFYLGYKRMNGERIDKEDAVADMLTKGIRSTLPADALALFEKGKAKKSAPSRAS